MSKNAKTVIKVRHEELKKSLENYAKKVDVQNRMKEQFEMLLRDYKYNEEELYRDPVWYFYECVEDAYSKENTLRLSGMKLVELLQLNADKFRVEAFKYNDLKKYEEPTEEQFTDYAETEEELSRLTYANRLIDLVRTFEKGLGRVFPKDLILSHSPQVVYFNFRSNAYEPNIHFIKQTNQRGL
jgi:hypothetical protein